MLYHSEAIILKRQAWREYDLLATVYAKERGKITVRAIGALKNKSKLRPHLELFSWVGLSLAPSKKANWDIVAGAVEINCFASLKSDVFLSAVGFYVCELLDKIIPAPEKDLLLWDFLIRALEFFNALPEKEKALVGLNYFQWKLLEILGYGQEKGIKNWHWREGNKIIQFIIGEEIRSANFLEEII